MVKHLVVFVVSSAIYWLRKRQSDKNVRLIFQKVDYLRNKS